MEPEFHTIPLASSQHDIEADMNELMENSLKYQTFNKNEIKYLYNNLVDNCIYFLETSYESLYSNCENSLNHQEYRLFIEKILRNARFTIPLLYSVMYYIKRFRTAIRNTPQVILGLKEGLTIKEPKDLQKVFVSAAVLSIKFFNDRVIMNAEWTKFIDISVEQINLCERQFIRLINYNLNLNVKNYYIFINDYLKKFNNSSSNKTFPSRKTLPLPVITTSSTYEGDMKRSSELQSQQPPPPIAINNNMQSANQPIYNTPTHNSYQQNSMLVENMENNNNNTTNSSNNIYLSITPTPSVGSQVTPTPSGDRLLTPIDTTYPYDMNNNNNNNNNYNNYNNGYNNYNCGNNMNFNNYNNDYGYNNNCCQTQMNPPVLYSDPMSIGEQNSPQHNQYPNNINYPNIMKTNSDSTFVSDSTYGNNNHSITSPQYYCNSICNNKENCMNDMNRENIVNTLPTPKNTYKSFSTMSCSSCSSECTLYQSNSMDEDNYMMQDQNNNRMPLNKLLYHNLHMKQNYSKIRKINEKGKENPIEEVDEELEEEMV